MTYNTACKILSISNPKAYLANAAYAKTRYAALTIHAPLKYHVACAVIISAAR